MALVACFVTSSLAVPQTERDCPRIITRAEWGATPATTPLLTTYPPSHVIVHNTNCQPCTTIAECSAQVRAIQNQHLQVGHADINCSFLIGDDGNAYEGRGWGKACGGTSNAGIEGKVNSICFISLNSKLPSNSALQAAQDLLACGVSNGQISSAYKLVAHSQIDTNNVCPGEDLNALIQGWPHWTNKP